MCVDVKITVSVGPKIVAVEDMRDPRIVSSLKTAGREVGAKLAVIKCPEHKRTATNVRLHFDKNGTADLKYDSCCEKLGAAIGRALG